MLKKGGTHSFISKCIVICSTFLVVGIVLFNTVVVSLAAANYSTINDTVYKSADAFGLEELPYGEDTGVVQFQYGDNYLTLYFDKLSIYSDYSIEDYEYTNLSDYYWNVHYVVNADGTYDYKFNIESDNPIYYKTSYDSTHKFSSTIGKQTTRDVYYVDEYYELNGSPLPVMQTKTYVIYTLNDFLLSSIVPSTWTLTGERRVYSNCYQSNLTRIGDDFFYLPQKASGQTNFVNGSSVGYNVEYYPTCEYLQNSQIRSTLANQWYMLMSIDDKIDAVLTELYSVNYYLSAIDDNIQYIYNDVTLYLPLIEYDLAEMLAVLQEMKSGPEYDSSQGIGSNTEFGDAFGNLTDDTVVPGIGTDSIVHSLGNSFLFIRSMFDKITVDLNLVYVISFLLGLSFIAYVLGRVIKNKMNG